MADTPGVTSSSPARTQPVSATGANETSNRPNDVVASKPTQQPSQPSTAKGVTVPTQPGDSVESVRNRAFEKMAEEAGLSGPAQKEFAARAAKLDDGKLHTPAASEAQQPTSLTPEQARRAIDRGEVTVAPTQAQAGLLKLMQANEAEASLPVPGGTAIGTAFPTPRNSFPGQAGVTPEVAQEILKNVADGKPPFKPELGEVGRVSWFTTEGNPHVGTSPAKSVTVPVEITNTSGKPVVQFGEQQLLEIYNRNMPNAMATAEQQLRQRTGKTNGEPLSNTNLKEISRNAGKLAERAMWTEVGETVRASESGVGKVKLENSAFSKSSNGEFTLTSKAENVRLAKGATTQLVEAIQSKGKPVEPQVLEAAKDLATKEKWTGRVQGAFRVGGKVLIVVGALADGYRIYTATDKVKTTVEVAGGWTGAALAGGAFATWFAPADAAGPWAWAAHGVGTLGAGAIGYFAGSEITKTVYELTVEGKPLQIPF
jgi:hypothetical protein